MNSPYLSIPSPCYVLEAEKLKQNALLMQHVQQEASVEIILALKGFAMWSAFPMLREYVSTCTASSLHEALLCNEHFEKPAHTYAPAYRPQEMEQLLRLSSHMTFNSYAQFEKYVDLAHRASVSCGLRVNPGHSEVATDLYNPCAAGTRLGASPSSLPSRLEPRVEGLHFHALCESDSHQLERVLRAFEQRFAHYLPSLQWVNFGGGHLMTADFYDIPHLIKVLRDFKQRYPHLHIILEPGSAFAWKTGFLKSTILDIVHNDGIQTLILDISFTAHMPDTLEMPYRPSVRGIHTDASLSAPALRYRLGGMSCLSGDYLDEYGFIKKPCIGDTLLFEDMIHYTMVKTTTFNGVPHPGIGILDKKQQFTLIRKFDYADYKNRLS